MSSEDGRCAKDHVLIVSRLPVYVLAPSLLLPGGALAFGVVLVLQAVGNNRPVGVRMLVGLGIVAGCGYVTALLCWRLVNRGRWVRCRGGVVEVLRQWRWEPVGAKGSVKWEVLGFFHGNIHVFLEGDINRSAFVARANKRDVISAQLAADPHFAGGPTKGIAPY